MTKVPDRKWGSTTKRVVKLILTLLVLIFVARHVAQTGRDLLARGLVLHLDPAWLGAGIVFYLLGLFAYGIYFWRVVGRSATPVGFYAAVRAYLISHLAKYVPGKAMVVVIRAGMVAEAGARPATAAFATLYETLAMMAAGGLVAAAGFLLVPADRAGGTRTSALPGRGPGKRRSTSRWRGSGCWLGWGSSFWFGPGCSRGWPA